MKNEILISANVLQTIKVKGDRSNEQAKKEEHE